MKTITIAAIKGGTGKTATAGALAQAAAAAGKKVLAVDLDPQSSLSIWMGADLARPGSYDVIARGADAADAIQETEGGIDIICGGANLAAVRTSPGSARRLERALAAPCMAAFSLAVIDTAPAMGELQNNALFAADGLLIPLEADSASLQGYYQITDIARHVQQDKPALRIVGVIVTKYDARPRISRLLQQAIKGQAAADGVPYMGEIRQGVAVREAIALQADLFRYAPRSKPAQDYKRLYDQTADALGI